ncbi:MAG: hypothetical protein ACE5JD_03160 [Candidatus Methylomirabilia bacterium]
MGWSRSAGGVLAGAFCLLSGGVLPSATAEVRVAEGLRVEVVVTGIPRPVELAFDASGSLVVLSHGWRGDSAAEIYRLDLRGLPLDSPPSRVVIPFSEGPRKATFGSLAVHPKSGDLFLGEENGNRVYRLTAEGNLELYAVGLQHLVGGSSLAFDGKGRLVALDYASPAGRLRSEARLPPALDWLRSEAYQGPLVFRLDPKADIPLPRRFDLVAPLFPKGWARRTAREVLPRFISVTASPAGNLVLLGSLGEVFRLTPQTGLHLLARLPAGDYRRTNMAVGPEGAVFVSSGFHVRRLFRISPAGAVTTVARELGDPGGVVADQAGNLYIAETALHRIIRIRPLP